MKSAARAEDFPPRPAAAFAGRSNAGKSSAINALCNGRFARISATPGRTRLVNFFALGPDARPALLADLPGYGYAAASKRERAGLAALARLFVREGEICGLALIVDCRRGIGEMDERLIRQYAPRKLPLLVALSKADKLGRGALIRAVGEAEKRLVRVGADGAKVLPFSALKKTGVPALRAKVAEMLDGAGDDLS